MIDMIRSAFRTDGKTFLLVGLLCFAAFAPILGGQFKGMDDDFTIVTNADLRSISHLPEIFTSGYFKAGDYYRPLTITSYMAEFRLFGLNPFFFNLDNLLLHILNAWLVFILAGMILGSRRQAWWVALFFAIHPLQWEAVGNISGRAILLCAAFVLAAFILFLRYLKDEKPLTLGASVVCFAGGLLSKESAAILIGVMALYMFLTQPRRWQAFLPFVAVIVVYLMWRQHCGITHLFPWSNGHQLFLGFTTFLNGVFTYLRLIVLPLGLYFDRSMTVFPVAASLVVVGTWLVYALGGVTLWAMRDKITPVIWLALGWFALELLPVSQLVTSIGVHAGQISLAEHFLYMALIPSGIVVVLGAGALLRWLEARAILRRDVASVVVGGLVVFFVITSLQQSFYASNEAAMLKQSLMANARNARVHSVLARMYVIQENYTEAEKHFRYAVQYDPAEVRYRISLGQSLADQGRYEEALVVYADIKDAKSWALMLEQNIASAHAGMKK